MQFQVRVVWSFFLVRDGNIKTVGVGGGVDWFHPHSFAVILGLTWHFLSISKILFVYTPLTSLRTHCHLEIVLFSYKQMSTMAWILRIMGADCVGESFSFIIILYFIQLKQLKIQLKPSFLVHADLICVSLWENELHSFVYQTDFFSLDFIKFSYKKVLVD